MTDAQKAQFLDLSAQHLDLLKSFYQDVQLQYFGRVITDFMFLPQAILDAWSGVPVAVKESLRLAGIQMQWLMESAPAVPNGGAPHGTPENWAVVWIDTANSTEDLLHTAAQTMTRTGAFTAMVETWRRFAAAILAGLGAGSKTLQDLSGAVMVVGALLIIREFTRGK